MTKNARIRSTMLGIEDHGIMTFMLDLDYGGSGQGFGGYGLDAPIKNDAGTFLRRDGTAFGCDAIKRVLETVGVEQWEKLPGQLIRVRFKDGDGGWGNSGIHSIGHAIEDRWLSLADLAEQWRAREGSVQP